jgi:hypothetical protein
MAVTGTLTKRSAVSISSQSTFAATAVKFIDFAAVQSFTTPAGIVSGRVISSNPLSVVQDSFDVTGAPIGSTNNRAIFSGGENGAGWVNTTNGTFARVSSTPAHPGASSVSQQGSWGVWVRGTSYQRIYQGSSLSQLFTNPTGVNFDKISINPSQNKIAVSNQNGGLIYVFANTSAATLLFTISGPSAQYRSLHMDDNYIVATTTSRIYVYSAVDGTFIREITPSQSGIALGFYRLNEISISFSSAAFTEVINIETGTQRAIYSFRSTAVAHNSLYYAFRPSTASEVRIYDKSNLNLLRTISTPSNGDIAIEEEFLLVGAPGNGTNTSTIYLYK